MFGVPGPAPPVLASSWPIMALPTFTYSFFSLSLYIYIFQCKVNSLLKSTCGKAHRWAQKDSSTFGKFKSFIRGRQFSWRRKWPPTPVLLPGKSHGQRSIVGYSPRGRKESDTTERLPFFFPSWSWSFLRPVILLCPLPHLLIYLRSLPWGMYAQLNQDGS